MPESVVIEVSAAARCSACRRRLVSRLAWIAARSATRWSHGPIESRTQSEPGRPALLAQKIAGHRLDKVKALAVSTLQRSPLLPQVPTVAESAVSGFDVGFFYGIAAPAKVHPVVVRRVRDAIREITDLPDVRTRMASLAMSIDFRNDEQFREMIAQEYQKYGAVIRQAGIHPG